MLVNLQTVEKQLDNISAEVARKFVYDCGLLVEARAKELCPKDTGDLANSIKTELINDTTASVGTNKEYAIYVHEGTGLYAKGETSRPKGSYWIYIKKPTGEYDMYKENHSGQGKIYWDLNEAKRAMAILQSKGLDAHITQGRPANPFLTKALEEQQANFDEVLQQIIKEAIQYVKCYASNIY